MRKIIYIDLDNTLGDYVGMAKEWKLHWKTQSTQKVFSEGIKPMPYATTSPRLVIEELYKIISIQRHVTEKQEVDSI